MNRAIKVLWIVLLAVGALRGVPALAQQNVGGITGTITDATGAVVPGVTVTAEHQQTKQQREAVTTGNGIYALRQLQIGDYTLRVSTAGFKTFEQAGIPVVSAETVNVDISLQVGDVTETVTVEAAVPTLDTTTESVGTTRTQEEIGRLPITLTGNSSRTAAAFARTAAGVNFDPAEAGGQDFMVISRSQINGGMAGTWGYQIDGVESGTGDAESAQDFVSPIPEAIEEFRLTANADASSGFNGGVTMELTMKSGSNDFHGTLFWYNRNDFLSARNFFSTASEPGEDKQNEFGYAFGGPIIKNKTFFFSTLDVYRFRTQAVGVSGTPIQIATVPTALMRGGDFSELLAGEGRRIYDPLTTRPLPGGGFTRDPFPNNIIDPSRLSPISLAFQDGYRLPTRAGTQLNWVGPPEQTRVDKDQWTMKIDHNLNDAHRFSFTYEATVPWFLGDISGESGHSFIGGGSGYIAKPEVQTGFIDDRDMYRWRFTYLWTVSPNVLFNFRTGTTRNPDRIQNGFPIEGPRLTFGKEAGLIGMPGEATPTVNPQGFNGFGPPFSINHVLVASQKTPVSVGVSWFKGSHNFKFGADFMGLPFKQNWAFNSQGTFSFTDRITGLPGNATSGSGWASMLIGEVDTVSAVKPFDQRGYTAGWGFYLQDQWRFSSKWTFTYGLRYDVFQPFRESHDKIGTFDPTLSNPAAGGNLGALALFGTGQGRNGFRTVNDTYWKGFGPHLGFAYAMNSKTVLRASYSYARLPYFLKWYGSQGPAQPQVGFTQSLSAQTLDNGITSAYNWNDPFPLAFAPPGADVRTLQNGSALPFIDRSENFPPTAQNISFEIGRELPGGISIRTAWVANLSRHLQTSGGADLNALPLSELSRGSLLLANINSPEARAAGIPIPYQGFNGSVAQALRPYPQYQGIPIFGAQFGASSYHGLQTNIQKRMGDLTFLAAYTISKQLTNTDFPGYNGTGSVVTQHPDLRGASKALLNKDRPQFFNLSWAYDLPFGTGKRFMGGASKGLNYVIGGWRLSAIQNYFSGEPFRVSSRATIPGGFGGIWPNRVEDQAIEQTGCGDYDPGNPALNRRLNIGAFATPAPFTTGNISRVPNVRNCAFLDEAIQIEKFFAVTERFRFHLGSMMMNAFNRHVWRNVNADVGNPATFGTYTVASPSRNIQFFLKVEF